MRNLRIEAFEERLNAVVKTLVHEPVYFWKDGKRQPGPITNIDDIWKAMRADPAKGPSTEPTTDSGTFAGNIRTWQLEKKGSISQDHLNFIYTIYPSVRGILDGPLDRFWAIMGPKLAARREWEVAMDHLARHRAHLAELAKRYYAKVDETQRADFPYDDFPLVAKQDWILDRPLLLNGAAEYDAPAYRPIQAPPLPSLDGIEVSALALKETVTLRKRLYKTDGRPFSNGLTYRVVDIQRRGEGLHFVFGNSTYFEYINTCEARALELARADLRSDGKIDDEPLPIRVSPSDVFSFLGRSTFPGVNCLTILRNYEEPNAITNAAHDVYLLHYRGAEALEAQNCVHVVPAGGHQPLSEDLDDDASLPVWKTAAREFLEELLGHEQLDEQLDAKAGLLDKDSDFQRLFLPSNGREPVAKVYLLGAGIDPVTTKVEILISIVVDWCAARAKISDLRLKPNYEGKVKPIRFKRFTLERKEQLRAQAKDQQSTTLGSLPVLPAGAACFQLAAEHYEALMGLD